MFDLVGGQRTLSTSYIKQLHQLLTQSQDSTEALDPVTAKIFRVSLIKGDWKRQSNNPLRSDGSIHEYSPPEQVASEMDRLIALHHQHRERKVPPEIESAWLHHRFTAEEAKPTSFNYVVYNVYNVHQAGFIRY